MPRNPVAHFECQVQALSIVLEDIDNAQALSVMRKAAGDERVENALAGVAEWRVADVMPERDRLGQLLVQSQHLRDAARDLRDFERMREPRAVMVARRREEDLCLMLQTAEGLGVDDAIAIPLKRRPD